MRSTSCARRTTTLLPPSAVRCGRCCCGGGEGRAFCAGRDIQHVTPESDDAAAYLGGLVEPLLKKMAAFPAPTFAAVQGACLGVGLGLLLATDVVYVAENAKFGSPLAKLGATGAFVVSKELVAQIRDQRLGLWEAMQEESTEQARLCKTEDYAEGFPAFQEKREPRFTGGELLSPVADL